MPERKLATIRVIAEIHPIEGADKIVLAIIDGWQAIVKKDEFKVGDLCVYCEIDSILPNTLPVYEFLQKRKYRIKTIRLRKQVSQGLVLQVRSSNVKVTTTETSTAVTALGEGSCFIPDEYLIIKPKKGSLRAYSVGDDVTEPMGITKWLPPSERDSNWQSLPKKHHNWFVRHMTRYQWFRVLFKKKSRSFPEWISKTDENRLQNMPWILKDKEVKYYVTEKIDYQSVTYWYKARRFLKDEFGVCSRTVRQNPGNSSNWSKGARELSIKEKLKTYGKDIAIQGELGSISCQGNKYKLTGFRLFVFRVFDIGKKHYFTFDEMVEFCKDLDLEMVPLLDDNFTLLDTVQDMVKYTHGQSKIGDTIREGVVIRSKVDHTKSFKVIDPEFLLKYGM